MEVSKSTVAKWFKEKKIRAHTNQIKPSLNDTNMLIRVKYVLHNLEVYVDEQKIKFNKMEHVIHIDEKWFYMTRALERYYLAPEDEEPHRTLQSKNHIAKVMFLSACGRPIYNHLGECIFDGKIGVFAFIHKVAAQRKSKNRARGTLETKALDSITRDVTRRLLIDEVIPAIKAKWPVFASKNIIIQQDNAKPHIQDDDVEFRAVASTDGFNIHLAFQPPNSPDTNINDLGWFRALQSLQVQTAAYNLDELVKAVQDSFIELSHTKLNNNFLSLQQCMIEILKAKGNNNYKQPHMSKDALTRAGLLPHVLEVDVQLVKGAIDQLREANFTQGLESLMEFVELIN